MKILINLIVYILNKQSIDKYSISFIVMFYNSL